EEFGAGVHFKWMLHPPTLRQLGLKKKLGFGRWAHFGFRFLASLKWLRGTPFDIFGRDEVRREERLLIEEYKSMISSLLNDLNASNYSQAVEMANLPDMIRGYETIKLNNIATYRAAVAESKQLFKASTPQGPSQ
ncbi:MAG: DUF6537 domain-containing protein, partial [Chloroflexota bacterium]